MGALFCCLELGGWVGEGRGLSSAEEDGICALNCSHYSVRKSREGVPCTFSVMPFNVSQAGTGFLRPDEFLRQFFAIAFWLVAC